MVSCGRVQYDIFWFGIFFLIYDLLWWLSCYAAVFGFLLAIYFEVLDLQFLYLYWLIFALYSKRFLLVISNDDILYGLDAVIQLFQESWWFFLDVCFVWFSQIMKLQLLKNYSYGDDRARIVHAKRVLCARNYVHVNQSKHL